jgi:small conductance mechanosensitive channel
MLLKLLAGEAAENEIEDAITEEAEHVSTIFTDLWSAIKSLLPSLGFAVLVLVCGILLSKIFIKMLHHTMQRSNIEPTASHFLESLIRVALYVLVAIIVLSVLNVPMTSIITVIGTAGLAIGLALQDSLSNVAGGFIIMFTKPLKVGDLIKFDNITGTVESIGILQMKLLLPDRTTVFIPNSKIAEAVIVNYSEQELRRLDLEFGISYGDDFEQAKKMICELIAAHPMALTEPEPLVRVGRLEDSAVVLFVRIWTNNENYWNLYYDMQEQVKLALDKNGISIPFPQVEVHCNSTSRQE